LNSIAARLTSSVGALALTAIAILASTGQL